MPHVNSVVISGNLTRDPELHTFGEDGKVANLGVAVNRRWYDKKTEDYVEEVSFVDVKVWGGFGGLVARKLKKADSVTVAGRLEMQSWETDGVKRSKLVIIATDIDSEGFFRSKDEENDLAAPADSSGSAPAQTPAAEATEPSKDDIPF